MKSRTVGGMPIVELGMEPIEIGDFEKEEQSGQIRNSVIIGVALLVAMFDALLLYRILEDAASSLLWCVMFVFISMVCCTVSTWTTSDYGRSTAWLLAGLSGMTAAFSFLVYVAIWVW